MDHSRLLFEIANKRVESVDLLLSSIEIHKRLIKALEKSLEQAESINDVKAATKIRNETMPHAEKVLIETKKALLKTIAENAYEVINSL